MSVLKVNETGEAQDLGPKERGQAGSLPKDGEMGPGFVLPTENVVEDALVIVGWLGKACVYWMVTDPFPLEAASLFTIVSNMMFE